MSTIPLRPGDPVPVLETERLRLRRHEARDLAAVTAMWSHPDVVRYIGGKPFDEAACWTKILRYVGHWSLLGFGYWVVEERVTGEIAGEIGFADFHRDMRPSIHGIPEAGWVLAPHAHGRGFATEALRAAHAWADARFTGPTVCIIDPANHVSIRVAGKLGYVEVARTTYGGEPVILFERPKAR